MMGETKSRRSPNNLPTRPAGVRGSDHRPSAFQRRREGISGVLLAATFAHSLPAEPTVRSSRHVPCSWRPGARTKISTLSEGALHPRRPVSFDHQVFFCLQAGN